MCHQIDETPLSLCVYRIRNLLLGKRKHNRRRIGTIGSALIGASLFETVRFRLSGNIDRPKRHSHGRASSF
jgi:hypothetical protein